jgi:uncharacterized protein with FMN-binding domain
MRRAVLAVLGTAVGTSLLVGAKLGTPSSGGAQDVAIDTAGGEAADEPRASGKPAPAATAASAKPSAKPPASGRPTARTTVPAAATRTTVAKPPATGLKSGTFIGAGYRHEYGTVRVTITISGGAVTAATATYPTDRATSRSINERAVPKLNSWAVAAKTSANISTVSGATLTSDAYEKSLQSALDKAKA